MLLANFDRKEHLRHRAVSLRQHGFLVIAVAAPLVSIDISSQNFHVMPFGKVYKIWNDNIDQARSFPVVPLKEIVWYVISPY